MRVKAALLAGICATVVAFPVQAQDTSPESPPDQTERPGPVESGNVIVVTAQRRAEALQNVPIAVSAFSEEALEAQQIDNASDLQLTLPNVSFTKGNFTAASFTIRGIGDLCVGTTCDSATAIHVNGSPVFGTRLFETEYFDLERIEVLRGPQGTLFGRNATAGVVNIVTAKPDLTGFHAKGEAEYGNYNSIKAKAMINLPIGETLGVRVAGFYLNRDGYTFNTFNNTRIDDRDMYAVRGSIRWEPTPTTTLDLMGYYFHERDNRMRIQKQLCQRDPTGVLGCLNATRNFEKTNFNSTFVGTLGSQEFLNIFIGPSAAGFGASSLYGPDAFSGYVEPKDVRRVGTQFTPEYFADELQLQAHLDQGFGNMNLSLTGMYQETEVDSREDYYLGIQNRSVLQGALNQLSVFANPNLVGPAIASYFAPLAAGIIPNGPAGQLCTSDTRADNLGAFEGYSICGDTPGAFDRSNGKGTSWSAEAILSSDFDGPLNFLVGAIYANSKAKDVDYYVNAFGIDYVTGLLGSFTGLGSVLDADPANNLPPGYFATSFYRNNSPSFTLKSYGIFGEVYFDISDRLKLTAGLRYNNDKKYIKARTTLAAFFNPYSNDGDPFSSPYYPNVTLGDPYDADPGTPGLQDYSIRNVGFDKVTGRAVLDFQMTPNNLLYASYSRGYKSGGINPPLSPIFAVPDSFGPEKIDAFEIGSKNTFLNGRLQVNLTGFYYKYSSLQLSRIIARTSVNDTIDANIWGVELESIIRPSDNWLINMGLSYLNAEVAGDQFFANPRDPGGGDPNAVIIKDITNGALCAVTGPSKAATNGFVAYFNSLIGLRAPTAFPDNSGIASTGAFSICEQLEAFAPAGIDVLSPGVEVNLKGNKLPQAPEFKASLGVQYTYEFMNSMTLVPRFDVSMTGTQYGNVFNGSVNRIAPFTQANAQIQLNGPDDKWFVRAFVQNIFDSDSVTGLYVTDASSGNYTNIFTLEPRRYGIAAGVSF
ncbi:TonB-dependent receptor [Tsuneonella deserti]|uniref:TonB-dependent receptor n=1 Tax=Tsuneonella deserti TaxID=2035528 RepID=A0ABQ1SBA4_9SPHN|nr:TonB-dependent receptor [Tsuneonella deserti]GGE00787.1 TonB-dependent receptor [Tsuneonella deserti]